MNGQGLHETLVTIQQSRSTHFRQMNLGTNWARTLPAERLRILVFLVCELNISFDY